MKLDMHDVHSERRNRRSCKLLPIGSWSYRQWILEYGKTEADVVSLSTGIKQLLIANVQSVDNCGSGCQQVPNPRVGVAQSVDKPIGTVDSCRFWAVS